jgi:hypothetical protein
LNEDLSLLLSLKQLLETIKDDHNCVDRLLVVLILCRLVMFLVKYRVLQKV